METFKFVQRPKDKEIIGLKWVLYIKNDDILGYKDTTVYNDNKLYAPVTRAENVKVIFALAQRFSWKMRYEDIRDSFLYS